MVDSKLVATGLSKITESSIEKSKKVPVIEGLRSSSQVLKEESILSPKQQKRLNDNGEYDSAFGFKSNSGSGSKKVKVRMMTMLKSKSSLSTKQK